MYTPDTWHPIMLTVCLWKDKSNLHKICCKFLYDWMDLLKLFEMWSSMCNAQLTVLWYGSASASQFNRRELFCLADFSVICTCPDLWISSTADMPVYQYWWCWCCCCWGSYIIRLSASFWWCVSHFVWFSCGLLGKCHGRTFKQVHSYVTWSPTE